ncbi:hypothetical protein DFJ74DRAFT_385328 [Hyaloraphidium curvatum]|nr:hypothetical protein DFJ74DRAFT_385328 [Hyaloraphidium curvatum]
MAGLRQTSCSSRLQADVTRWPRPDHADRVTRLRDGCHELGEGKPARSGARVDDLQAAHPAATTAIATHFVNSLKFWDPREHPANTNRPFTLPNNELYDKVMTDPLLLEICRDVYTELRDDLLKGLYLNPYWVAYHWQRFFDVLFRIQREHEALRKKLVQWTENLSKSERKFALRNFPYNHKLVKPFNVLPRFSTEAKHILIDRIALHQLIQVAQRRLGQEPTSLADYLAAEAEDPEHWWRMFFRPEKVNTGGAENPSRHFDYSFSTDAVKASITVRVRKPAEEQPGTSFSDIKIPGMSVAGLDPGSTAILTISTGLSTPGDDKHHGHSKAVSVSAGEYYHLARYKNNTWKANQRKKRHPSILEIERDTPVAKASTVAHTKLYIHHCLKHLSTIVGFYGTKVHRRSRFDRYIGKHTAQEAVAEKVIKGCGVEAERLILAFGKARFRHNMRGGVTTPGSALAWLKRILRRRGVTVTEDVEEDMTSQICAACWEKVGKQHPKNGHYQIKDCRNPDCLIKCWNRFVALGSRHAAPDTSAAGTSWLPPTSAPLPCRRSSTEAGLPCSSRRGGPTSRDAIRRARVSSSTRVFRPSNDSCVCDDPAQRSTLAILSSLSKARVVADPIPTELCNDVLIGRGIYPRARSGRSVIRRRPRRVGAGTKTMEVGFIAPESA